MEERGPLSAIRISIGVRVSASVSARVSVGLACRYTCRYACEDMQLILRQSDTLRSQNKYKYECM